MLYNRLLRTTLYSIVIIPALYSFRLHASDIYGATFTITVENEEYCKVDIYGATFTITSENEEYCEVMCHQNIRKHRDSILKQLSIASIKPPSKGFTREHLEHLNNSHFFPLRYKLTHCLMKEHFNSLFSEELSKIAKNTELDITIEDILFSKLYTAKQKKNKATIKKEVLIPILEKINSTYRDKKDFISSVFSQSKREDLTHNISLFLEQKFEDIVSPHYNNPMLIPGLDSLAIYLTQYE